MEKIWSPRPLARARAASCWFCNSSGTATLLILAQPRPSVRSAFVCFFFPVAVLWEDEAFSRSPSMALADELSRLAELRASGGLTEDEFVRAKERLLNTAPTRTNDPLASTVNAFRRSRTDRWFGGVCGGMARSTGMESWVWRLLFAALFIVAGVGLLVYLLLWIFVPSE